MPTTTNYGWTTPADTDLVKDGASAIRTLGTAIDTTTKNLNPSTTLGDIEYRSSTANTNTRLPLGTARQVLQVNSGATAPEWAASASSTLTTTGDLLYASSANTLARRGIGSTGDVLTVSGGVPTWAAPAGGAGNLAQVATGSMSGTSVSLSSLTSYTELILQLYFVTWSTASSQFLVRLNNNSTSNYFRAVSAQQGSTTSWSQNIADTCFRFNAYTNQTYNDADNFYWMKITNSKTAGFTDVNIYSAYLGSVGTRVNEVSRGVFKVSAALSSIDLLVSNGNSFNGGTYTLWGA